MIQILNIETSTPFLAVATTVHLAMLLLRMHRNPAGRRYDALLLPAAVFAITPWLFPTAGGVAARIAAHLAWFVACDRLVPRPPAPVHQAAASPPPRPALPAVNTRPAPTPGAWVKVPVVAVLRETPDITTFRMARPDGFDFKAGQFLTVRFWIDGKTVSRCYSVSSAPEATGYLEISVKRQGLVSGLLHATVRPGSLLDIMRPAGGFVYPSDDHRPITLLAGGVGITPLMSMLRHAVQADPTRPVTLLYSVRTQHDVAFRDELAWLARRHRQAKVVVTTSDEPPSAEFLSGMINRELLTSQVEDLQDNIFLLCGPPPMIKAMKGILRGARRRTRSGPLRGVRGCRGVRERPCGRRNRGCRGCDPSGARGRDRRLPAASRGQRPVDRRLGSPHPARDVRGGRRRAAVGLSRRCVRHLSEPDCRRSGSVRVRPARRVRARRRLHPALRVVADQRLRDGGVIGWVSRICPTARADRPLPRPPPPPPSTQLRRTP